MNTELLKGWKLSDVENVQFKSLDGTEVEGFVYRPPGFSPAIKYPTILRIHGGPVAQYSHSFRIDPQLYAANGYVVIETNPRGSSGYGQDFSLQLFADWGNKDYLDVVAGIDAWERINPFNDVGKITTPTLWIGGAEDWNVPIINSEQMYQAMKRLGRETQLVVYPGEHHGIRRLLFQKDRMERYLGWYDKYVKGEVKTKVD